MARKPQRKRLTRKQGRLVKAVIKKPNATLDEFGQSSGYSDRAHVSRALKAPAVVDALAEVRGLMGQDERLAYKALLNTMAEGLEATEVRSLKVDGAKFKVSAEVKDFAVRRNYMRDALELHGVIGNKVEGQVSGPINIAIVLAGGGSETEKAAVVDVMLASRRVRGLHPTENRRLTPDEVQGAP